MIMQSVNSSNIAAIGYENGILRIVFHNGGIYDYSGISQSIYTGLISAFSKGKYFDQFIKDRYVCRKIR